MKVITSEFVKDKKVLLRYDLDVPIEAVKVTEDFRLKAGLPTLRLCLEYAKQVIIMGHIGRPDGEDSELSVEPIYKWLENHDDLRSHLSSGKLKLLENLRFEIGEDQSDMDYAKELVSYGEVYINEAFAAYHKAASTTVLPTLLPSAAGLRFAQEVKKLKEVRENPKKPLVVILGGAKVQDKLPVVQVMSKIADSVLIGGKLIAEIKDLGFNLPENALLGDLKEDGLDITEETIERWKEALKGVEMIIWNGPVGKVEVGDWRLEVGRLGSARGTYQLAKMILESGAETIIGGGDTIGFLGNMGLLEEFEKNGFVSVGGGAMLKFLTDGNLPTTQVLE